MRKMIIRLPLIQLQMVEIMKHLTITKNNYEEENDKETNNEDLNMKANDEET